MHLHNLERTCSSSMYCSRCAHCYSIPQRSFVSWILKLSDMRPAKESFKEFQINFSACRPSCKCRGPQPTARGPLGAARKALLELTSGTARLGKRGVPRWLTKPSVPPAESAELLFSWGGFRALLSRYLVSIFFRTVKLYRAVQKNDRPKFCKMHKI